MADERIFENMKNEQLIEEITKLTKEWYTLIGPEHHKDRDCHWYIETKWSYGQFPTYSVRHYGYILDEVNEIYNSYELALGRLKELLTKEIKEYIKDTNENN
jgi:hypothetical protein